MSINKLKQVFLNDKSKLIFLVIILSALSFNRALKFHLFTDDWYQIIGTLYYPEILKIYFQIHPVNFFEFKFFSPLFKFNPYPWQFLGYLLKVIDSLSMWALIIALTNSKRAALYGCLIFAVFVVGIESVMWPSAHSSPIIIPLINLGFYFWIKSEKSQVNKSYFYSLILFALSILAEPGRSFIVIFLVPIWEFLSVYQKLSIKRALISFLRIILLFLPLGLATLLAQKYFNTASHSSSLFQGLSSISLYKIIQFLENPLFGWTLLLQSFVFWATTIFLFTTTLLLVLFIWKKREGYKITIFLTLWVLLFYLPNFLTQTYGYTNAEWPMESRYYAISAVGVVGLLSYVFSLIKSKYVNWIVALFLMFNLYVTNNLLIKYSGTRSILIHNKIWDKIDKDVLQGEKVSIFMYSGTNFTQRTSLLDWLDTIPFAVRRGITKKEEFPIMTTDKNLIARLICEKGVLRHSPFGDLIQKEPIPLSHVHAWELKNGELENRSDQERDGIKRIAGCLQPK